VSLTAAGIDCAATDCDVTDDRSVSRVIARAQQLGTVTSIVHTAGVSPTMGSAEKIVRINALGTVLVDEALYEIATPGMSLVNVASVAGHQLPGAFTPKRRYRRSLTDPDRFCRDLVELCNLAPSRLRSQIAYVWP
jgi:hypothetical protein